MSDPRIHRSRAHPAVTARARVAARSSDPDRACHWTIVAALALFLAVMLLQIGG